MFIKDLAKAIGTSDSNLDRWAKQNGVNINALKYRPATVASVTAYYEKHGRKATEEAFPHVKVRSIVERYRQFSPRQIRWADEQIIEATKMAGLVSPSAQANYFNRPRAFAGSVKALWVKRFGFRGGSINGMVHWYAKELVTSKARYLQPVGEDRSGRPVRFRRLILWVDMEKCLKPSVPEFLKEAISTLADFQRWLWKSDDPKPLILKMIQERERPRRTA